MLPLQPSGRIFVPRTPEEIEDTRWLLRPHNCYDDDDHGGSCNCDLCVVAGRNSSGFIYSDDGEWIGDE